MSFFLGGGGKIPKGGAQGERNSARDLAPGAISLGIWLREGEITGGGAKSLGMKVEQYAHPNLVTQLSYNFQHRLTARMRFEQKVLRVCVMVSSHIQITSLSDPAHER